MICNSCKIDRLITDFLNKSDICYKCVYRKKTEKPLEKQTSKTPACRMCGKEIVIIKNLKKRQRTVFCSDDCAEEGHKECNRNYWTRKVRVATSRRLGG